MTKNQVDTFLQHFSRWASRQDDIQAVALVGSYARDTACEDSDVDLVIIVRRPQVFLRNTEWTSQFGHVERTQIEDYGKLISLRVWYDDRREIEYGFADESWARPPLDEGTLEVISGGMMVLFERGPLLSQHGPDRHTETQEQRNQRLDWEEVAIVPYDPQWPELFRQEKEHLLSCLPNELIRRIEHFGSTAVPGLAAKPVVDMLVEVTDLEATKVRIVPVLESQGYDYFWRPTLGDDIPPFYAWFIKRSQGSGTRTHHIHMITAEPEFLGHWDRLLFRDYLTERSEVAKEYQTLKMQLASAYPNDRVAYTAGKAEVVAKVTDQARQYYERK